MSRACRSRLWACALWAAWLAVGQAEAVQIGGRVAEIRQRDVLNCGVWPYVPGFAVQVHGQYAGFEIDLCRAVATAVLGDASKVEFVTVAHVDEFTRRGEIDLVIRRLTRTHEREAATSTIFGPVVFHDGQGFLVPRGAGVESVADVLGSTICVIDRERHPSILLDYLQKHGRAEAQILLVQDNGKAERELSHGRCSAYSADISWLAAARSEFLHGPSGYDILPDTISTEPLAPLMRATDTDLIALVRRTIAALVAAEELGITSGEAQRLRPDSAQAQALAAAIAVDAVNERMRLIAIVKAVGNYGEIYERNLGEGSSIKLIRGSNRLCSQGGLMCTAAD